MHPPTRPSVFSPRPSCAAALLGLSILLLGGTCSLALDRGPLEIEVLPPDLMADTRVRLRLVGLADELPGNLAWSVEAGRLFSDDAPLVEWRTPREPGRYHLVVRRPGRAEGQAGGEILAERTVEVKRPSTEGRVWIPGGEFLRGDVRGTVNVRELKTVQNACDEPAAAVELDGFWIDRHPVTHEQYCRYLREAVRCGLARVEPIAVMGWFEGAWVPLYYFQSYERLVPYYHDGRNARRPTFLHAITWDGQDFKIKSGWERSPVVDVSWFGAAAYARFHGARLPSEAQWEKAARGARDGRRYPWGDQLPTAYHAVTSYHNPDDPAPIGLLSPLGDSPFGVADMLTQCFEWTNDWFNAEYYSDTLGETTQRNPTGTFWGRAHTIRGLPYGLQFPQASFDDTEPVSNRYSWHFEFQIGDVFANRTTTFRTVLEGPAAPRP